MAVVEDLPADDVRPVLLRMRSTAARRGSLDGRNRKGVCSGEASDAGGL